jgi:hypothetical protein
MAGVAVSVIALLSLLTHTGLGWITALKGTGKITGTFSLSTRLGQLLADTLDLVGYDVTDTTVVGGFRLLGLAGGLACCLILLRNGDRLGAARATGLGLTAIILLSPVVWPWYLGAGFALVAATGINGWRPSLVFLTMVFSGAVLPTNVVGVVELGDAANVVTCAGLALVAFLTWRAPRIAARWHRARGHRDPTLAAIEATDDVLVA